MSQSFYSCLFDEDQHTCFGETHKSVHVSRVRAQAQTQTPKPFFTINALHAKRDLRPTESYHAADRPRRADHNVICFRNILIEMDFGTTDEQLSSVFKCNLPFSTCVSSGGKSLHFIISLQNALSDALAYRKLVKQIYDGLVSLEVKVDVANKNPSRFSRAPGATRPETGRPQELIAVYGRVSNELLESWIHETLPQDLFGETAGQCKVLNFSRPSRISQSTDRFLKFGAPPGEWNSNLFRAACNLFEIGCSTGEVTAQLQAVTGTLDSADVATLRSAERRARAR